ncbi:disks large homolog 5-like isoform X1 [Rattus norvegicus]|uniref:disks large homolog 5-like isoform X1 n=1 Tax=Rattus norvegicus TaxID=10116 RepID=UPI002FD7D010
MPLTQTKLLAVTLASKHVLLFGPHCGLCMLYALTPCGFTCVLLPTEACRQTSSPENILNKVQANEEEERLNRELELTTKERNELTDRLLYVTGGSMNKRASPYFRPNPFYENLKIKEKEVMSLLHNLDTKNIEHREKFQELKKDINFYRNLHSRLLMDQACMKKKLVTLRQESKEVQRYLFELNPNDEDEQEKTSNLQTQQNVVGTSS